MKIVPKISVIRETRYEFDLTPEQVMEVVSDACKSAAGVAGDVANFMATSSVLMTPVKVSFSVPDPEVSVLGDPTISTAGGTSTHRYVRGDSGEAELLRRHRKWHAMPIHERSIVEKIEATPSPFSPVQDLNIVQSAVSKLTDVLADEMGVPQTEIVARWKSLWFDEVLCGDKHPTGKGIARLLAALRYRVAESGQND